jgi:hypothetical protein
MAINFAKFIIIASLISGSITYITGELPVIEGCNLPANEKTQTQSWVSSIMGNKTITDDKIAASLAADLANYYRTDIWIVNSGLHSAIVTVDKTITLVNHQLNSCFLTYNGKKIIVMSTPLKGFQ